MRNKKLIPFETIEKAVTGEPEAIDAVLRHYTARIKYLSTYRGHINDDIQDRRSMIPRIITTSLLRSRKVFLREKV